MGQSNVRTTLCVSPARLIHVVHAVNTKHLKPAFIIKEKLAREEIITAASAKVLEMFVSTEEKAPWQKKDALSKPKNGPYAHGMHR